MVREPLQRRSSALVKTLVYKLLMVLITVGLTMVVTGRLEAALQIGVAANAVKTVTYHDYECVGDRIAWGIEPV